MSGVGKGGSEGRIDAFVLLKKWFKHFYPLKIII